MLMHTKGNLLDMFDNNEVDMIAHGANCFNLMGAGIAKQIKDRYPEAFYADKYYPLSKLDRLGNFSEAMNGTLFNLYTQYHPGPNARYAAIELCFTKLNNHLSEYRLCGLDTLGIPLIGCGIGGLQWDKVEEIISQTYDATDIVVVTYEPDTLSHEI